MISFGHKSVGVRPHVGVRVVALAVFALCAGVVPAAAAGPVPELEDELHDSQHELSRARSGLVTVGRTAKEARRQLRRIDARLRGATARLGLLEQDLERKRLALAAAEEALAAAEDELAAAEDATERATMRLEAAEARLRETEQRLAEEQSTLELQAAHAYKYGGGSQIGQLVETVLTSGSPSEVALNWHFVASAFGHQKSIVEEVDVLRVLVLQQREEVAVARAQRIRDEEVARRARLKVAQHTERRRQIVVEQQALVAQQRTLVSRVRDDQRRQKDVLARLQEDERAYVALVSHLEGESERLAAELADAQEAARRAAAARAARQSTGGSGGGGDVVRGSGGWTAGTPGRDGMVWPTDGAPGSRFGYRTHPIYGTRRLHAGVDIGAPSGQSIVAAKSGVVVSAGWRGGYGNATVIDHGGGLATLYAHQSGFAVHSGEYVETGEVIGYVGSTGMSTGPHLHFEVRVNGSPRDPMDWY